VKLLTTINTNLRRTCRVAHQRTHVVTNSFVCVNRVAIAGLVYRLVAAYDIKYFEQGGSTNAVEGSTRERER
jgi:hypothetical protein